MPKDMLEDICERRKSHLSINRIEARYKINHCIKQRRAEQKGEFLSTLNIVKVSHKVFKAVVNELLESLPIMGESG